MLLLRWLWIGNGNDGEIPPIVVFWTLRVLMFMVGFVLEDWAIDELIQSQRQRHRHLAMLLVASSYTTWTYQTHTFSNSIETLVVAWSLVLIERIVASPVSASEEERHKEFPTDATQQRGSVIASTVLGVVAVFGVFNRITFPAFLLIPGLRLLPYYWKK
jgi:GPI mannosyltransferase 4